MPNIPRTINRPENEPLLSLKNMKPAVEVKNAITIQANAEWITSSHKIDVSVVENIRGSASTVIELTVKPSSNDIIPVRDQILNIDTANSTITVEADTFVGGSADAGVGYTTTSSY